MPIDGHYNRVTMIVRNFIHDRFTSDQYAGLYDQVITTYQSNTNGIFVRKGRAKVEDRYPVLAIEAMATREQYVAIDYFKEIEVELAINCIVKVVGSGQNNDGHIVAVAEDYIMEFAELTRAILNAPESVQFTLDKDHNGSALPDNQKMFVYTSFADQITFDTPMNSAIRSARIHWAGKVQKVGKTETWLP